MKRIIIYYSNGGTTDLVAKTLAKKVNADLVRIHDRLKTDCLNLKRRVCCFLRQYRDTGIG